MSASAREMARLSGSGGVTSASRSSETTGTPKRADSARKICSAVASSDSTSADHNGRRAPCLAARNPLQVLGVQHVLVDEDRAQVLARGHRVTARD